MPNKNLYETVVGLEVHAQLLTKSKLFCGDSIAFGAPANTHISPITLGHPGTLPKMNKQAIEFAIKMGLACHCEIEQYNYFARKNYFYPDLPKGYQVSQHTTPICKGGFIKIKIGEVEKNVRLNRIHMEEDAGKSIHPAHPAVGEEQDENTYIDYNRAGTPLLEIVSEPDLRGAEEAFAYVTEIRKLVRYLGICDGNMEEGSLRCDANISVRKKGDEKLGTRVEVKNLNSIRNVKRAIEIEANRLINLLDQGKTIVQQTRSFDADNEITFAIRDKEDADDYRYFAEPDLTPLNIEPAFIERIRKTIPPLAEERMAKYVGEWNLSTYDATVLTEEKEFADYFEKIFPSSKGEVGMKYKAAANWMLGPVKSWLNENTCQINDFPLQPQQLASLIDLIQEGKVNFSVAASKIFPMLIKQPTNTAEQIATEHNLLQSNDTAAIEYIIDNVLKKMADKVLEYKKGKKGLLALFVGEVMKQSKGKADPKMTNELLIKKLTS